MKRTVSILLVSLFLLTSLSVLASVPAPASAAVKTSQNNTASFSYTSVSYYNNPGTSESGSSTLNAVEASSTQSISINSGSSYSLNSASTVATYSVGLGNYQIWTVKDGSPYVLSPIWQLNSIWFSAGQTSSGFAVGSVYVNVSFDGYTYAAASHTFDTSWGIGGSNYGTVEASPSWYSFEAPNSGTGAPPGYYSVTLQIQVTSYGGTYSSAPFDLKTFSGSSGLFKTNVAPPSQASTGLPYGWTYSGQSASASWSNPSNVKEIDFSYSSSQSGIQSTTSSGTHTGTLPTSTTFTESGDPNVPSLSISWTSSNIVAYETVSPLPPDVSATATITENTNWFNSSTYSFSSLDDPSGAISSSTWPTIIKYTVSNLLVSGYQATSSNFRVDNTTKTNSTSQQYYSYSGTLPNTFSLSLTTQDFVTYQISTTASPPDYSSISQSPVTLKLTYNSPIQLKEIDLYVLGSLTDRYTSGLASAGATGTASYSYSDPSLAPITVHWKMTTGEYTQWDNTTLGGSTSVPENSSSVIVLQSDSVTHSYPITLTGVPQEGQVPITISNSQSNATGVYQQLINFPTSTYSNSINANFSDVYFSYQNGTTIPAWIQSNASNTYSSTPIWLKLNSIGAGGSVNVYAHIVPNSVFFGQAWANIGENWAIQNNTAIDNGANVWIRYAGEPTLASQPNATRQSDGVYFSDNGSARFGTNIYLLNLGTPYVSVYSNREMIAQPIGGDYADSFLYGNNVTQSNPASQQYIKWGERTQTHDNNYFEGYSNNEISGTGGFGTGIIGSFASWNFTETLSQTNSSQYYNSFSIDNGKYYGSGATGILFSNNAVSYEGSLGYEQVIQYIAVGTSGIYPSVIYGTLQSSNDTQQYYQQQITISGANATKYGLNSQDSNFQIATSSGTPLYTWIQSTSGNLTFWTKTPYSVSGTETLNMQVFPAFENRLSATGYLGEYPSATSTYGTNDNGRLVFPLYDNFAQPTLNTTMWVKGAPYRSANNHFGNGWYISEPSVGYNYYQYIVTAAAFPNSIIYTYVKTSHFLQNSQTPSQYWFQYGGANPTGLHIQNGSMIGTGLYDTAGNDSLGYALPFDSHADTGYWNITSVFITANYTMPNYTIGSGSVFQANASTTSSFQGTPGKNYNATWQYMTYNIPLGPNSNYTTVLINSSWTVANLFPSTYKVFTSPAMILFDNLTGFASIQVSTIQPSTQIGQSSSVSLSLQQQGTNDSIGYQYQDEFSPVVSYTPFGSSVSKTIQPGSGYFSLPYGSTAKVSIQDYWGQVVGTSTFSVDSSSIQKTISLNVSLISLIANNTGALIPGSEVSVRSGNLNFTGTNPVYIANGTTYEWYATALNPQSGEVTLYSGSVTGSSTSQTVKVKIGAPVSSLVVNARSYSGAGNFSLSNPAPGSNQPTASMKINNISTFFGQTFIGTLNEKVNIKIYDVLNQLLFETNLTLNSPTLSEIYNITTKSYVLGLVNQENGTANETTQYNSIHLSSSSTDYYNWTTAKGLESEVYLKAGVYDLHTHDSVNTTLTVNLSSGSRFYSFNNTNLSEIVANQFPKVIGVSFTGPGSFLTNTSQRFFIVITYPNGTLMNQTDTDYVLSLIKSGSGQVDLNLNGSFDELITPYYISPGKIGLKLNLTAPGSYVIQIELPKFTLYGQSYSPPNPLPQISFTVSAPTSSATAKLILLLSEIAAVLSGILTFYYVARILYRRARAREIAENGDDVEIANNIRTKLLAREPVSKPELAFLTMTPKERRMWLVKENERVEKLAKKGKLSALTQPSTTGSGKK